jgi:drug/metabolite transporter (DMT)-like permease
MMLALANVATARRSGRGTRGLNVAILVGLATGVMVSVYTTVDAYGVRAAADPFTFIVWLFFLDGIGFPVLAWMRWRRLARRPPLGDLAVRGIFGAIIAFVSFGALMLATRLGKVGEAAALRETSIIFATAIGVLIFREQIDARRLVIIGLIALGAILVEFH